MISSGAAAATAASACAGSVRSNSAWRGAVTTAPASRRRATTTRPRKPEPPVTRTGRPDQKSLMAAMLRVARAPAWAGARRLHAGAVLARRARRDRGRRARRWPASWPRDRTWNWSASRPGTVDQRSTASNRRSPCGRSPCPRTALYEAWRRLGWPPVERATGAVDVVHATTIIVPPRAAAPLVVTLHDLAFLHDPESFTAHGVKAFMAGLARIRRDAAAVLCSSQATLDDARGGRPGPRPPASRPVGPGAGRPTAAPTRSGPRSPAWV